MELTKTQQSFFNLIETTFDNYFIGGEPGTGKSVLTRHLLAKSQKYWTVAAPTGLAALNAMGKTLHSLFGIPVFEGIIPPDYNEITKNENVLNHIRYGIKGLIIDEVSMVRCDLIDYIDRVLRMVKGVDKPFGGIQVLFIGDFYQLPPVAKPQAIKQLRDAGYESPFAFDSNVFNEGNFKYLELTEVLRQKSDKPFMKMLKNARDGSLTIQQVIAFNKQVGATDGLRPTLVAQNWEADSINSSKLKAIKSPEFRFVGQAYGNWKDYPVDIELYLKVGAQVIVKKNGADKPPGVKGGSGDSMVVNGTLGTVTEIEYGRQDHMIIDEGLPTEQNLPPVPQSVTIKLMSGNIAKIYRKRWEKKVREKNHLGVWEEKLVASYEQMPLALAWAISMHKSQGQTFERVHIDPNKVFTSGQLYVAVTRATTLKGISLERPVKAHQFYAPERVMEFFETFEPITIAL